MRNSRRSALAFWWTHRDGREPRGPLSSRFVRISSNVKRITFGALHVWEFKDDAMSRENMWLHGGSIVAQLTPAE